MHRLFCGLMTVLLTTGALGQAPNRSYMGEDIFVASGQQIHNATCIFCSVQVEGDVEAGAEGCDELLVGGGFFGGADAVVDVSGDLRAELREVGRQDRGRDPV